MTIGRPTKLTPELQAEMVNIIRVGNYVETACAYVGLNKSTFYDWLKRGARELDRIKQNPKARIRKEEEIFVEFSNAIKKAEAEAEARDVLIIGKAAETQWQAAAWRLERRLPKKWGRSRPYQEDEDRDSKVIQIIELKRNEDQDDEEPTDD